MKKLKASFRKRNKLKKTKSLSELDDLYKNTLACFPEDEKIKYCQRLIARLNYELENNPSREKKTELNQLLIAANLEIEKFGVE